GFRSLVPLMLDREAQRDPHCRHDLVCWRTHVKANRHSAARRVHNILATRGCADGVRLRRRTLALSIAIAITAATVAVAAPVRAAAAQTSQSSAENTPHAGDYKIPAGPLDTTLNIFAAQAGVHVDYSTDLVAGKTSGGVSGIMFPRWRCVPCYAGPAWNRAPSIQRPSFCRQTHRPTRLIRRRRRRRRRPSPKR